MRRLATAIILTLVVASCGASNGAGLEVTNVWGRPSPSAAANAAFYLTITNNTGTPDRLIGVSSPACSSAELHETYMKDGGVMGMRPVPGGVVEIPPGATVEFKPGGLHVMCIDIEPDLEAGGTVPLTLTFERAGDLQFQVEIQGN
jgi:copper(I)-binding protein